MNLNNDDKVLLKLRRQYSKNEAFNTLMKNLSSAYTEIGKLKSEVAYLENELKRIKSFDKEQVKEFKKEVYVKHIKELHKTEVKSLIEYKKKYLEYQELYFKEKLKNQNTII